MSTVVTQQRKRTQQNLTVLQIISVAVLGMILPYSNLYLKEQDVSPTLIGTLLSVGALLRLLITPLANNIADRLGMHRRLFKVYYGAIIVASGLYTLARSTVPLGIGLLLLEAAAAPGMVLGMQLTISKLQHEGRTSLGTTRSFAPLGFAVANVISCGLIAIGGYRLAFGAGGLLALATIWLAAVFPRQTMSTQQSEELRDAAPVPRNRGLYILAVANFFAVMGFQSGFAFTFIHFSDNLGVPASILGLMSAWMAILEVPSFRMADTLLVRFGARKMYITGTTGMAIFFVMLGAIPNAIWLIAILVFRAAFWPMVNLSGFVVTTQMSDPRNVATNQALIQVTLPGIAALLTGSAAGWIFEHQGGLAFFAATAIACLVGAGIALAGYQRMAPTEPGAK